MRSMVEGASASTLAQASDKPPRCTPPPPRKCAVPLPRCAGADKREHSRGAPSRPSHANHHAQEKDRGRRSAERRMPSIVRAFANKCTQYAPLVCCADARQRGALAFRRFAADSPRQSQPALAQPQAVFPGTRLRRVSPAFACPSPARSAQTGLFAGPTVSRAARERSANPRAGTAPAPLSGLPREQRPSVSEILYLVLETETNVNEKGTTVVLSDIRCFPTTNCNGPL